MRILSLYIEGYKIFNQGQKIDLGKDLQLLIGVNGSGKSSVLEAIAIIFSQVKDFCETSLLLKKPFNFAIEYYLDDISLIDETSNTQNSHHSVRHVSLSSSKETGLEFSMYVDEKPIKTPHEMYNYLPDNLIFYYSGACETLEEIIDKTEGEQADALYNKTSEKNISKAIESISKNIIYIRKDFFPLLFALNYIDSELKLPLNNKGFYIKNIRFDIKQYRYTKSKDYKNLYNLSGFLRAYFDNILKHSYGLEYNEENEYAYFNLDFYRGIFEAIENLPNLTEDQKFNQTRFLAFHFLSLLYRIGFIKKIQIQIVDDTEKSYFIDALSEGEQQLIILDAIKRILCKKNTVLFLDEPDAYLHPQRQRELIPFLNEIFTESSTQIIATSHSPFVAQSVNIENILVFNNNGKYKNSKEEYLSQTTINNELFGIESEYNINIENKIIAFKKLINEIQQKKIGITKEFYYLRNELDSYGEATRFITNFETRKLISNGFKV